MDLCSPSLLRLPPFPVYGGAAAAAGSTHGGGSQSWPRRPASSSVATAPYSRPDAVAGSASEPDSSNSPLPAPEAPRHKGAHLRWALVVMDFGRSLRTLETWQPQIALSTGHAVGNGSVNVASAAHGPTQATVQPEGAHRLTSRPATRLDGQRPRRAAGAAASSRRSRGDRSRSGAQPPAVTAPGSRHGPPRPGARPSRSSSPGSRSRPQAR
jgi:hypothetical protein